MTPTEVRLALRTFGYAPIPLRGKNPGMKTGWQWQTLHDAGADQIEMWGKVFVDAGNTGVLTRLTPAFDIDILDQDAADAVEQLARDFHEEHGDFLVRFGRAPKRAILFRTNEPFPKLQALLTAPNGDHQKLEVLGEGQQLVVDGIHPDTRQPYRWFTGTPWATRQEQLPYVREADMRALLDAAVVLLEREFGYRCVGGSKPKTGNGGEGSGPTGYHGEDWAALINNIRDGQALHDSLRDLAAKLMASGMDGGAAVNYLRSLMDASTCAHDERWSARRTEIPRIVSSAEKKFRTPEPEPTPAAPAADIIPNSIDETIAVFARWLDLSDMTALYAVLGTVAANMLPQFDPVWLGVIAPPSSAKTELLRALSKLPHVVEAATFTPAGLLSGTPKKQRDKYAKGGLLNQIGEFGIIVLKGLRFDPADAPRRQSRTARRVARNLRRQLDAGARHRRRAATQLERQGRAGVRLNPGHRHVLWVHRCDGRQVSFLAHHANLEPVRQGAQSYQLRQANAHGTSRRRCAPVCRPHAKPRARSTNRNKPTLSSW